MVAKLVVHAIILDGRSDVFNTLCELRNTMCQSEKALVSTAHLMRCQVQQKATDSTIVMIPYKVMSNYHLAGVLLKE
jgi:hypothetical protein